MGLEEVQISDIKDMRLTELFCKSAASLYSFQALPNIHLRGILFLKVLKTES
jgi:hypothetical protein